MFGLLDRIPNGVEPMLTFLESYITQSGVDDMKASAEIITTVMLFYYPTYKPLSTYFKHFLP